MINKTSIPTSLKPPHPIKHNRKPSKYQPSANGLFALKSQSIASMAELEAENRKITE